jgi:diguanylate cyclase (GGDEF) domain
MNMVLTLGKEPENMNLIEKAKKSLHDMTSDETLRFWVQFLWINRVLAAVCIFMSIVNLFTKEYTLMISTMVFAGLSLINVLYSRKKQDGQQIIGVIFCIEALALLTFFLVFGIPDGFSILWCILLPPFMLEMFGLKKGTIVCAVMFALLIFFFWIPAGRAMLLYEYGATFELRFPMLYSAFYLMGFFLETIRAMTQQQLVEARENYRYLYIHDALTGAYNRYGFNNRIDEAVRAAEEGGVSMIIMDIDHFKAVNDNYGHLQGDEVLCRIAAALKDIAGDKGDVCRWGGEEFAVLLSGGYDAAALAEEMRIAVSELRIAFEGTEFSVTASFGVAATKHRVTAAELVTAADGYLYKAKSTGRNKVVADEV